MATYTSTNSRPCPDCGLRRCPAGCDSLGLLTSILPENVAERFIYMEDGTSVTVPVVDVRQHPADYVTMTGVLEAFDRQPQGHAAGQRDGARVPVWALVCLFLGLVLTGLSMVGLTYIQYL